MTTFDDREKAFENRYAHEQDVLFRAQARRDHRVALWAAEKLGKRDADAEAYAADVLTAATEGAGAETVVGKILADFKAAGVALSEHQVRSHMESELATATADLKSS